jgi:hypothetical protein
LFNEDFSLGNGMPNAFLCAKAIARMIANEDPYKEGEENNTVTFLKMFLPERFTNPAAQSLLKKDTTSNVNFDYE